MSKLNNEQILSNIYCDLGRGYGRAKSFYEQAKQKQLLHKKSKKYEETAK